MRWHERKNVATKRVRGSCSTQRATCAGSTPVLPSYSRGVLQYDLLVFELRRTSPYHVLSVPSGGKRMQQFAGLSVVTQSLGKRYRRLAASGGQDRKDIAARHRCLDRATLA